MPKEIFSLEKEVFPYLAKTNQLRGFVHEGEWSHLGTEKELNNFLGNKIII